MTEMIEPQQCEQFAGDVIGLAGVVAADVLDRDPRSNRPLVEVTVGPGYERVPPRVLRCIAEHDLGIRHCGSRPEGYFTVEVV